MIVTFKSKLIQTLSSKSHIVEAGPLGTRLKYNYNLNMTPAELIDIEEGRKALNEIYRGDIDVAQEFNVPIIINSATYRASKNHLKLEDVENVNIKCLKFIKDIRSSYGELKAPIFIGASLGSMNDAYSVDIIPEVETSKEYHQEQINIFKEEGVDFVNVVTIPSFHEALGIAYAASEADVEYTIGFILNDKATLLDGTSLNEAIQKIDNNVKVTKKPLGYLVTCTHASVIAKLAEIPKAYKHRFIGVQTNGSNLTSKELASSEKPIADDPESFAFDLCKLQKQFNLKIIGGCCGTSREHLRCVVEHSKF